MHTYADCTNLRRLDKQNSFYFFQFVTCTTFVEMNYLTLLIIYLFIKRAEQYSPTVAPLISGPYLVTIAACSAIIGIALLVLILKCIIAVCLRVFIPKPLKTVAMGTDPIYDNKRSNKGLLTSELYYNVIPSKCDKQVQTSPRRLENGDKSSSNYYVGMFPAKRDNEYVVSTLDSDIEQPCYSSLHATTQYDYVTSYSARGKNSAPCNPPEDSCGYELVYAACNLRKDQPSVY